MFGVDQILSNRSDSDDYYKILGCSETATVDQIIAEYRVRALKCHPDKNVGNESALQEFQKLQEARDTLTDPEKKSKYDQWKNSGICMPYKQWLGLSSRSQMTMHWVNPKTGLMLEEDSKAGNGKFSQNADSHIGNVTVTQPENFINPEEFVGKLSRPWKSENSSTGIYGKFRKYQI